MYDETRGEFAFTTIKYGMFLLLVKQTFTPRNISISYLQASFVPIVVAIIQSEY